MVNVVVPDNEVLARAIGLAERIAANAPLAVEESLAIARQAFDHDETALRAMMDRASVRLLATEDLEEGVTAFLQKRKPQWKGR
jgi:enoyl-CoA hydratase/carnithine racemase